MKIILHVTWGQASGLRLKIRVMVGLRLSLFRRLASLAFGAKPKPDHYPKLKPEARVLSLSKNLKLNERNKIDHNTTH